MLGKNITIIGGSGGMGRVFTKYFKKHGFNITLYARNRENLKKVSEELDVKYNLSLEGSVKDADLILVSVPIRSTPNMIREVSKYAKKNTLLFDICSLKTEVFNVFDDIINEYQINLLSLHPMFGPGIEEMRNYLMLVLKFKGTDDYEILVEELLDYFRSDGVILTETTPKIHDKRIAFTLGVPHMFNILFLKLLKSSNEPLNELTKYTGTTFLLQKVFAESIIQREMEMFGDIQMKNKEFHKILDEIENLLKNYKKIIQNGDKKGFFDIYTKGLDYSKKDNHFKDSYKYFYDFMKILKK